MDELPILYVGPRPPQVLRELGPELGLGIRTAATAAEARQELAVRPCALAVLDLPLPDEFGTELAADLSESSLTQVLLLSPAEPYPLLAHRGIERGVPVLPKPADPELLRQAVGLLLSAGRKLAAMERRAVAAEQKAADLRFVGRAKLLLMEREHLSEAEAHRYLEKTAMDLGMKVRQVAIRVIHRYD